MVITLCLFISIFQLDLVLSLCSVPYCEIGYCDAYNCTKCQLGYHSASAGCLKCYLYCKQCGDGVCYEYVSSKCASDLLMPLNCSTVACTGNGAVVCSSCPDGFYYLNGRCNVCNHINCKCTDASVCDACLPGYYGLSNFCNSKCPADCTSCLSTTDCEECVTGKYGKSCEINCTTTCADGSCDKVTGTCSGECASNEFFAFGKCYTCDPRCTNCVNETVCTECIRFYYWGSVCQNDCTGCFSRCNRSYGCSSGCDSRYYQSFSDLKSGYECIRCPYYCKDCVNQTHCQSCGTDHWGNACQYNCSGCRDACDHYEGCLSGCLPGYFREQTGEGIVCLHCAEGCGTCNNASSCQTCETGLWGNVCQFSCSGCAGTCDVVQGCESECLPGFYRTALSSGYQCENCTDKCLKCSPSSCNECESGYFPEADGSCTNCPQHCNESVCDPTDGRCTKGCADGFGGLKCNQDCPNGCLTCNQINSTVCRKCEPNMFGISCDKECSKFCKVADAGSHVCDTFDGSCINGCVIGHWGRDCSNRCELGCVNDVCNETSGSCLIGCRINYYGTYCENTCDVGLVCNNKIGNREEAQVGDTEIKSSDGTITGLAVGMGIICLMLTASIIGNALLLAKLRAVKSGQKDERKNATTGQDTDTCYQDLQRGQHNERTYSCINTEYENTL